MVLSGDRQESQTCRIALADDSDRLRRLVRTMLDGLAEFDVVGEARNGFEAVALVREAAPDLLLLDLSMPDMDGLHVLSELRRLACTTVVVVYSAFASRSRIAAQAREMGAADVLEKDLTPAQLCARLRAAWNPA